MKLFFTFPVRFIMDEYILENAENDCVRKNKIIVKSWITLCHCKYFGDLFNSWNIKNTHFRIKCYSLNVWIGNNIIVKMNKINKMILLLLISNFGTCLSLRISSFCRSWIKGYRIASSCEPAKNILLDLDWRKLFCRMWVDENYFVDFRFSFKYNFWVKFEHIRSIADSLSIFKY